jgi:chemotaxis signal transduction protein
MAKWTVFKTGRAQFALDQACIQGVEPATVTSAEGQGRKLRRKITYRGRPLTIVDLAASLDEKAYATNRDDARLIMLKEKADLALWADRVVSRLIVHDQPPAELPPVFNGTARAWFPKVLQTKSGLALIVEVSALDSMNSLSATRLSPRVQRSAPAAVRKRAPSSGDACKRPVELKPQAISVIDSVVADRLPEDIERHVTRVVTAAMTDALDQHWGQAQRSLNKIAARLAARRSV